MNYTSLDTFFENDFLDFGNLEIEDNTIRAINVNGSVALEPQGSGSVVMNGALNVNNHNIFGAVSISATSIAITTATATTINAPTLANPNGDITITPKSGNSVIIAGPVDLSGNELSNVNQISVGSLALDGTTVSATGDLNLSSTTNHIIANGDLTVNNLKLNGNTLSSIDTDGSVALQANGSGSICCNSAINGNSQILFDAIVTQRVTVVTSANNSGNPYMITNNDDVIICDSRGASEDIYILLPQIVNTASKLFYIKDNGSGGTYHTNISISTVSNSIDGDVQRILDTDYESITLFPHNNYYHVM